MKSKGLYIVIEGVEGVGKTTLLNRLREQLTAYHEVQGVEFLLVREPGGTEIGEEIRTILKKVRDYKVDALTEILLFCAARRRLYVEKVLPAIQAGKVVISDRSAVTMLAYQGKGHGQFEETKDLLKYIYDPGFKADLCITLDLDIATSRARSVARGGECRIEQESDSFFEVARAALKDPEVVGVFAKDLLVIDSTREMSVNHQEVITHITRLLLDKGLLV